MSNKKLRQELRQAGASASETAELSAIASRLQAISRPNVPSLGRPFWQFALATLSGLIVGAGLLAYAQTSLPGNWSYPLKRLSENTAVAIDPAYRATLMMRRSEEVKSLVNRHAGSNQVLATLGAYRSQAAAYKSTNYAAFEYCRNNLTQAASAARPSDQAAITQTLTSLQT
jgi:hypothetical protein